MARRLSSILFFALLVVVLSASARLVKAQQPAPETSLPSASEAPPPSYDTPPAITVVDGTARLLRQGQSQAAVINMPLIEGDRIITDSGRVAVTFPDGSLLHIDRNTTVDFLSMSLMRLLDGRLIFVVSGQADQRPSVDYQIDAPAGSARVQAAGEYKVSTSQREVELDVVTGVAALATDQGSVQVQAGERSFAREGEAPSEAEVFNSARFDAFDQWSESQRAADVGATSTQYLPSELTAYSSTFDRNGRWENDSSYGSVWYPTVSVGWRPYYNGYWDDIGPYGYTWIGYDPWCWPTSHFGRWGFRSGLWFWIPGRHWGPAWVSWGYSPGYYGWCPLDYYNRPLFGLSFGSRFGYRGGFDPWLGWTVVPRHRFGAGLRVANYAVPGARLAATERNAFAIQRGAPRGIASPRQAMAANGARAMPRALPSVTMQSRPRDSAFASARPMPRGGGGSSTVGSAVPRQGAGMGSTAPRTGVGLTAPRRDQRSLPYSSAPSQRYGGNVAPGSAVPRATPRQTTPYDNRAPSSRSVMPLGSDRPSAPSTAQPRGYQSAPPQYRSPSSSARPGGNTYGAPQSSAPPVSPRYSAPSSPRYSAPQYSAPRYSPPPTRGQPYAVPRYSAPASPGYSAPSYSTRPAPSYSAPRYSAPPSASPRYSAPSYSAPSYSAPSYSAPRGPSGGGYAAPRAGGGGGGGGSRPAPSGGGGGGGGGSRPGPSGGGGKPGGGRGGQ